MREALRNLSDYDLPSNLREQETLKSIQERGLAPFTARLAALLGPFTRAGDTQTVRGTPAGRPLS